MVIQLSEKPPDMANQEVASMDLNELQRDTLIEILNVGMGQAADSLSQMIGDEVVLSIPKLLFLPREEAETSFATKGAEPLAAVRQDFRGPFPGSAILIYPKSHSLKLVQTLLYEGLPLEELTELEQETLLEIGNIILNACLGSIADMMDMEFLCDLPHFIRGDSSHILASTTPGEKPEMGEPVLLLLVNFTTRGSSIQGYVVLLLSLTAIQQLKEELAHLLDRYSDT